MSKILVAAYLYYTVMAATSSVLLVPALMAYPASLEKMWYRIVRLHRARFCPGRPCESVQLHFRLASLMPTPWTNGTDALKLTNLRILEQSGPQLELSLPIVLVQDWFTWVVAQQKDFYEVQFKRDVTMDIFYMIWGMEVVNHPIALLSKHHFHDSNCSSKFLTDGWRFLVSTQNPSV